MDPVKLQRARQQYAQQRVDRLESARKQLLQSPHAVAIRAILSSPSGRVFVSWLEDSFSRCDLFDENDRVEARNLGRKDVVDEVLRIRDAQDNERTGE